MGGGQKQDAHFTVSGASSVGDDIATAELMDRCPAEDARRLGGYDPRQRRPRTVPRLMRFARRFMQTSPAMRGRAAKRTDAAQSAG